MKKLLLTAMALTFSVNAFTCDNISSGEYLCAFASGKVEKMTVDYGVDDRGDYVVLNQENERFYLDGNPTALNSNGNFLNVVSRCSDDQKTLTVEMNVYGSEEGFGSIKLTSNKPNRVVLKKSLKGKAELAFCFK